MNSFDMIKIEARGILSTYSPLAKTNFKRGEIRMTPSNLPSNPKIIQKSFLTPLYKLPTSGGRNLWKYQCICGSTKNIRADAVASGHTKSCGCWDRSLGNEALLLHPEHKYTKDIPEYRSFMKARYRCIRPSDPSYATYGGRGVEFRFTSYKEFFEHIGLKPTPQHTLDRKNSDGHYEVGNVKWSTPKEQARNRRLEFHHYITYKGETRLLVDWRKSYPLLRQRIDAHWCETCAFEMPRRGRCIHRTANAEQISRALVSCITQGK